MSKFYRIACSVMATVGCVVGAVMAVMELWPQSATMWAVAAFMYVGVRADETNLRIDRLLPPEDECEKIRQRMAEKSMTWHDAQQDILFFP